MLEDSCLGPESDTYNVAQVTLRKRAIVSQKSYLCTASHSTDDEFVLVGAPIVLEESAWVATRALVGPGVTIGRGAVLAAGAVTAKDIPPGMIYAGNPAREVSESALGQSDGTIVRQADR